MHKNNHARVIIFILILFAVAARIFALFFVESISHPVTWEYEEIANNILNGKGLYFTFLGTQYRNTTMMLYPSFCASVYCLTKHSFLAIKILQICFSVFSCILLYKIAKMIFGKTTGFIALFLISFHPGLIVYSVRLHSLTLDILLFLASIYSFLLMLKGEKVLQYSILTGLFIGMALLGRAVIGLFIPIALSILLLNKKLLGKKTIHSAIGIVVGVMLILSFLIVRNYSVFHKFVLLPNETGFHFWIGNNANSVGTATMADGKSVFCSAPDKLRNEIKGLNEFEQKDLFYRETWNFIKNNPGSFSYLFFKKLCYFWWFTPTQGLMYSKNWFAIYKIYYCFIVVFMILGIFMGINKLFPKEKQMAYALILICVTTSIAQALYYVDGRHRWIVEAFMLVFSANGIYLTLNKFKKNA